MDLATIITAFQAWLTANSTIYRAEYGSPMQSKLICSLDAGVPDIQAAFDAGNSIVTLKLTNASDNSEILLAWYEQIYLPSQS